MPPDLPNEQELILKKRARRRLVGAIALVLLMVIILPQVLQDRALLAQQEPIKITMPELVNTPAEVEVNNPVVSSAVSQQPEPEAVTAASPESPVEVASENKAADMKAPAVEAAPVVAKKTENKPVQETETKVAVKVPEASKSPLPAPSKSQETFSVQVGVYSDAENVKRLQEQLKQAGFSTHTEKVKTPKGDSLRLKAGSFKSREDAVAALDKIKAIGLSGIVIGNE
jgi:DedD protein